MLYTNVLALPPTAVLFVLMGEHRSLRRASASVPAILWVSLSCVVGLGISYTGWRLRDLITATTYTLVGVLNKMATVAITAVVFPASTSLAGMLALAACILCGLAYEDAAPAAAPVWLPDPAWVWPEPAPSRGKPSDSSTR